MCPKCNLRMPGECWHGPPCRCKKGEDKLARNASILRHCKIMREEAKDFPALKEEVDKAIDRLMKEIIS